MVRIAIAMAVLTLSCSSKLPLPPLAPQPTDALVRVAFPPPPARVEAVPEPPKDSRARWIDGEWTWRRRQWMWVRGRWVIPPSGSRFSPWTVVRGEDGTLWYARGAWRNPRGEEITPPEPISVGQDIVGVVVDADGNTHEPGHPLNPPGAKRRQP